MGISQIAPRNTDAIYIAAGLNIVGDLLLNDILITGKHVRVRRTDKLGHEKL